MQIQQKIGRPRRTPPPRLISARPHTARLLPKIRSAKKKRSACCSAHRDDSSNVGHDGVQVHDLRRRERRTPRKSRWGAAGCLARRYKDQRNARAGAIYGCRGGARRWGWDLCMHGSRAPRVKGCHSQLWARKGAGGYMRDGRFAPLRQLGVGSRRRLVATPSLVAAAEPPNLCRTSSPAKKCEHRVEIHLDKLWDLCKTTPPL